MTTEEEKKEPSMAEILASIRQILENNGTDGKNVSADDGGDILDLTPDMIVEEGKILTAAGNAYLQKKPPVDETTALPSFASDNDVLVPAEEMPAAKQPAREASFRAAGLPSAERGSAETLSGAETTADVSAEIIDSFTRMFEQNDFRRHAEKPVFDADALLRQIVASAVAERLDERMLQNLVKQTVVPVLEEWLSHYLPRLVADEVRRLTGKNAGF